MVEYLSEKQMKKINKESLKIWNKYKKIKECKNFCKLPPLFYPQLKKNPCFLYVGLNPSFDEKQIKSWCLKRTLNFEKCFISWEKERKFSLIEDLVKIENQARGLSEEKEPKQYEYYRKIKEDAQKRGCAEDYEVIDLLFIRQSKFNKNIKEVMKNNAQKEFIKEQLNHSKKIIDLMNPRKIVVMGHDAQWLFGYLRADEYMRHPSAWNSKNKKKKNKRK